MVTEYEIFERSPCPFCGERAVVVGGGLMFDEAAIAALKCAQTHDEHGAPESRKESEFKG